MVTGLDNTQVTWTVGAGDVAGDIHAAVDPPGKESHCRS